MLRIVPVITAVAVLALPSFDAGAQGKDKSNGKLKACAASGGTSAVSRDRCPEPKAANPPTQLQIGGSGFGSGGSTHKGGASGNILRPLPTTGGPLSGAVKAPVGSAKMK